MDTARIQRMSCPLSRWAASAAWKMMAAGPPKKTVLRAWSVKGMIMNHAFSNPSGYLFPERKKD
jgi:hypothetical protein